MDEAAIPGTDGSWHIDATPEPPFAGDIVTKCGAPAAPIGAGWNGTTRDEAAINCPSCLALLAQR
jgi:hypothetical protein